MFADLRFEYLLHRNMRLGFNSLWWIWSMFVSHVIRPFAELCKCRLKQYSNPIMINCHISMCVLCMHAFVCVCVRVKCVGGALFIQLSIAGDIEYEYKYSVASIIDGIKLSMQAIILMNAEFNEDRQHWMPWTGDRALTRPMINSSITKAKFIALSFGQKNGFSNRSKCISFCSAMLTMRRVSLPNVFICPDDDSDNNDDDD